jgi:hypothetical protein
VEPEEAQDEQDDDDKADEIDDAVHGGHLAPQSNFGLCGFKLKAAEIT